MSIIAASAGLVQAASLMMNVDSTILGTSVGLVGAGIEISQGTESKLRPEFSLLSVPVEDYYTRFSKEASIVSFGLPDVRLGFRYTPADTGYNGFYDLNSTKSSHAVSSTLYYVQGGYSDLPGAGEAYRIGAGVWDRDTITDEETGLSIEASQQNVALGGARVEAYRSVGITMYRGFTSIPVYGGISIKYSEDRPDVALARIDYPGESEYGQDKATVTCRRKNLDFLASLNSSTWTQVDTGWVAGLDFSFVAGMRNILVWEDFHKVGNKRLAGVVDGDSLLIEDGPLSIVGSASAKVSIGHGWVLPHLGDIILLVVSARMYASGVELYGNQVFNTAGTDGYIREGVTASDGTPAIYGYSLRPRTLDVGLQLSWNLSVRF